MTALGTKSSKENTKAALKRRGLNLAYFIIAWDTAEGIAAVGAGIIANSIALVGFGLDSAIEVFAAGALVWYLRSKREGRYRRSLQLISISFLLLATYVSLTSIRNLVTQDEALPSIFGIVLNIVALLVMIPTAIMQKRTGTALNNKVIIAQSNETWLSNYLSLSLLVGLGANAFFGWWWADPVVALLLSGVAIYEGIEAWQESKEEDDED